MHDPSPVIATDTDWPVRTVGEMTTLLRRGTAPVYVDHSEIMAIGQRCVTATDFDGSRSRPHSARASSKVLRPEIDDVLINSTGTGTIGRSVIFDDTSVDYIVDGHVTVARPKQSELLSRWLNDVLRSSSGQRFLEARCYAGSTNQVELSASELAAMPIAVPSVTVQRRAMNVLKTLDDQIRSTNGVIAKLYDCRSGLLDQLIECRPPTAVLRAALSDPPNNGIYKPAHLIGRGMLLIGQTAIGEDRRVNPLLARRAIVTDGEVRRFGLAVGDILVSRVFATLDGVGQPAIVEELEEVATYESNMMRLRCDRSLADPYFIFQTLLTNSARSHVVRHANLSNQASISQAVLINLPVWLPSLDEQRRAGDELQSADMAVEAERRRLSKLRALKSGLTADLLAGRVQVPMDADL